MANQNVLSTFNFDNKLVRTLDRDGEIWFVASDVCKAIEHSNPRMAIKGLDDDEKTTVSNPYAQSGKGAQELNIINESGLYKLILRSKKPEARKFTKWVTSEVLPQIRKTGQYQVAQLTLAKNNVFKYTDSALKKVELKNSFTTRLNRTRQSSDFFVPSHIIMAGRATNKRPVREISPLGVVRVFDLLAAYSDAHKNASGQALISLNNGASL